MHEQDHKDRDTINLFGASGNRKAVFNTSIDGSSEEGKRSMSPKWEVKDSKNAESLLGTSRNAGYQKSQKVISMHKTGLRNGPTDAHRTQ